MTEFHSDQASLTDLLRRTGAWVQQFADDAVYVVADERYEQEYKRKGEAERRRLLSEIILVRTSDEEVRLGHPWVQFRDVIEVDDKALPNHRGRLEALFKNESVSSYEQASALIQESARFNIGPGIRTTNVPCFALFFLYPPNQGRFRFEIGQAGPPYPPYALAMLAFREQARPTMIKSPQRQDLPARGEFWIEPSSGRVVKTRLEVKVARHWLMTTEVSYGYDAGIDAWVPQTMREHFGENETLDCTATYSNYRRFRTSGRLIVK